MFQSAWPEKPCTLVLPWTVTAAMPAASAAWARSTATMFLASQPSRILTVTGTFEAPTTAAMISFASPMSRSSADPAPLFRILGTGHPMLISMKSTSPCDTICAASAMDAGLDPKIWNTTGRSAGSVCSMPWVRLCSRISASTLTISENTRPAPISLQILRKGKSVMPAMGASTSGLLLRISRICMGHYNRTAGESKKSFLRRSFRFLDLIHVHT